MATAVCNGHILSKIVVEEEGVSARQVEDSVSSLPGRINLRLSCRFRTVLDNIKRHVWNLTRISKILTDDFDKDCFTTRDSADDALGGDGDTNDDDGDTVRGSVAGGMFRDVLDFRLLLFLAHSFSPKLLPAAPKDASSFEMVVSFFSSNVTNIAGTLLSSDIFPYPRLWVPFLSQKRKSSSCKKITIWCCLVYTKGVYISAH